MDSGQEIPGFEEDQYELPIDERLLQEQGLEIKKILLVFRFPSFNHRMRRRIQFGGGLIDSFIEKLEVLLIEWEREMETNA